MTRPFAPLPLAKGIWRSPGRQEYPLGPSADSTPKNTNPMTATATARGSTRGWRSRERWQRCEWTSTVNTTASKWTRGTFLGAHASSSHAPPPRPSRQCLRPLILNTPNCGPHTGVRYLRLPTPDCSTRSSTCTTSGLVQMELSVKQQRQAIGNWRPGSGASPCPNRLTVEVGAVALALPLPEEARVVDVALLGLATPAPAPQGLTTLKRPLPCSPLAIAPSPSCQNRKTRARAKAKEPRPRPRRALALLPMLMPMPRARIRTRIRTPEPEPEPGPSESERRA
mmetsp:Transcript_7077/g.20466  ORF Transcript_7077/g.20466 Transcript_7077/m.20466 type:complete len:283 (-) Transcript_7077:51-899(-)